MFKLVSGNSTLNLAKKISSEINIPITNSTFSKFSDGEISIQIDENVREHDVFVVQSTCQPVNDNLIELFLILDALKRASAKRVTAVIPYFGYARQDKKLEPRAPISAKTISNLINSSGADRIVSIDLHSNQIQGFFDCPVDNLFASNIFLRIIRDIITDNTIIVSPDAGGVGRANAYAKRLDCDVAILSKIREKANYVSSMKLIGCVENKKCIIIDDMIDTAGTLCKASELLMNYGAESIEVFATHPVLSGNAISKIENSPISAVHVTDTIPLESNSKFCVHSISSLLGKALLHIHNGKSISELFE